MKCSLHNSVQLRGNEFEAAGDTRCRLNLLLVIKSLFEPSAFPLHACLVKCQTNELFFLPRAKGNFYYCIFYSVCFYWM